MNRLKDKVALIRWCKRFRCFNSKSFFNEGANVILCDVNIMMQQKWLRNLMEVLLYGRFRLSNVSEIFKSEIRV